MKPIIAPSMLSADFCHLKDDILMVNESKADWFHLDIMDGLFVPNYSFGMPVIKAIASAAEKPLDVHLMIVQPERYIAEFKKAGADLLTVHWEACTHLHRTVHQIKAEDMLAGVALNPHTPVSFLEDIIQDLDMVLVMSVNPGFGGQKFIEQSLKKIEKLRELIIKSGSQALIEVDGGVDADTAPKLVKAGADVLVAGNYVFKADNPLERIETLKKAGSRKK
ncbi:MAG: ribulose-phosphate 3-epimerase [Bacteroidales bacterium]|nr:ribulose-phosphate 3-epimerase [Bacteroidales bacterium]MBR4218241.1 ribulose-phosphate 3-epimerase [Bacteroidales bacterium]